MNITNDVLVSTKYTYLLPLSYIVPTFYPTPPGAPLPQDGAPRIELDDPDLRARAQRLVNVLYWTAATYQSQDGMNDASTLKVFMAPEFYFRKASAEEVNWGEFSPGTSFGSYPEQSRSALAEALYKAIKDSPLFKDWVIVAGSICSALPPSTDRPLSLLNTAIMLRGQRESPDGSVLYTLMEKHYISNIDGPDTYDHAHYDPSTVYAFHLNPDFGLDNLIYWDGMRVGLEVCLDHSQQVVSNTVGFLSKELGPAASTLDLQLVTSCGMSIVDEAVAVGDGSLVMLTDGYSRVGSGLREPIFQLGRRDARTGLTQPMGADNFRFTELPADPSYQVTYAGGLYRGRQGVWTSSQKLVLNTTQK